MMYIEVFVSTRPGLVPNYEIDPISAVYFMIHSECAELSLRDNYQKINGAIVNKQTTRNADHV